MKRICFMLLFTLLAGGVVASKSGWKNFYSKDQKVGFKYLANWRLEMESGPTADAPEFILIASVKPSKRAERAYRGTNYSEASTTLSVASVSEEQCKQKFPNPSEPPEVPRRIKLGNHMFYRVTQSEGAAGNFYDSTTYHTFHDGKCYQFVTVIHTLNINNFDKGTVKAFNDKKLSAEMRAIVRSLYF